MIIEINVTNKRPAVIGTPVIVCGNTDYTIRFTFDADWDDLPAKTARFVYHRNGQTLYQDVVFGGDTVAVPVLSGVSYVLIGVYAGELHTTTPAKVNCKQSILCGNPEADGLSEEWLQQLYENTLNDALRRIIILESGGTDLANLVEELGNQVGSMGDSVTGMGNTVDAMNNQVTGLGSTVTAMTTQVTNLARTVTEMSAEVEALGQTVDRLETEAGGMPTVSAADNGKVLAVVSGVWAPVRVEIPEGVPNVSTADNGKILAVSGGKWVATQVEIPDEVPAPGSSDAGKVLQANADGSYSLVAVEDSAVATYLNEYMEEALGGDY